MPGMTATELQQVLAGGVAGPLAATQAATGPAAAMGQIGAGTLQAGMQLRAQTQRTKAMIKAEQRRFLGNMVKIMSDATMASLQQGLMARRLGIEEGYLELAREKGAPPSPADIDYYGTRENQYWDVPRAQDYGATGAPEAAAVRALTLPGSGAGMVPIY